MVGVRPAPRRDCPREGTSSVTRIEVFEASRGAREIMVRPYLDFDGEFHPPLVRNYHSSKGGDMNIYSESG